MSAGRGSRLLSRLAPLVASAALTVALAEVSIRLVQPVPDSVPIAYVAVAGDESYAPAPLTRARSLYGVSHRSDALGTRGPERPTVKPSGFLRVVAVGDSVTWGHGVDEESTWPAQLERALDTVGGSWEVWNLGVNASNAWNQRARFERLGPRLAPDWTVVAVNFNDLGSGPEQFRVTAEGRLSRPERRAPFPDFWRPLLESSATYHGLMRIAERRRAANQDTGLVHWPAMRAQLERLAGIAQALGSRVLFAALATASFPVDDQAKLADRVAEMAAARGALFVDLGPVLGQPVDRSLFLPRDGGHPNPEGQRRIAEAIAAAIAKAQPDRPAAKLLAGDS